MSTSVAVETSEGEYIVTKGASWLVEDGLLTVLDAAGTGVATFRDWNNARLVTEYRDETAMASPDAHIEPRPVLNEEAFGALADLEPLTFPPTPYSKGGWLPPYPAATTHPRSDD